MSTEKDGPAIRPHLANEAAQLAAGLRIQTGGGVVEHQQSGPVDERQCQKQALPQTSGECCERDIGFGLQVKTREEFTASKRLRVERAEEIQGLPRSNPVLQGGPLEFRAHEPYRLDRMRPRVHPVDRNGAATGLPHPEDTSERSSFAGAVRSQQPEDLARAHLETDVANRRSRTVDRKSTRLNS